jgi:hypothetical protein
MESRNIPVLVRTESKVKFVNNEYLSGLEGKICEILGMEAKISYNSLKNTGRITIKFDEFEKIQYFIDKLQVS